MQSKQQTSQKVIHLWSRPPIAVLDLTMPGVYFKFFFFIVWEIQPAHDVMRVNTALTRRPYTFPAFQQKKSRGQGGQKSSKCIKTSTPTSLWGYYCSNALKWNEWKVYRLGRDELDPVNIEASKVYNKGRNRPRGANLSRPFSKVLYKLWMLISIGQRNDFTFVPNRRIGSRKGWLRVRREIIEKSTMIFFSQKIARRCSTHD